MNPLFVSYFTRGSPYEAEAAALSESLHEFRIPNCIEGVTPLGSWEKNCAYKPTFIGRMMDAHPGRPIVWIDADARLRRFPDLFGKLSCDVAFHRKSGELLSGTLYFAPTKASRGIVERWQKSCAEDSRAWDQHCLQSVVQENLPGAVFGELPASYVSIFDAHMCDEPVIEHMQRSRKLKKHANLVRHVAILCPGESLAEHKPEAAHLTIAVNRAALAFECDVWAAMDYPMIRDNWRDVRGYPTLLSRRQTIEDIGRQPERLHRFNGVIAVEDVVPKLQPPTETFLTASFALMYAVERGAMKIKVYGADWYGTKDYDGIEAGENRTEDRWAKERHEWEDVLLPWLTEQGVKVERKVCGIVA